MTNGQIAAWIGLMLLGGRLSAQEAGGPVPAAPGAGRPAPGSAVPGSTVPDSTMPDSTGPRLSAPARAALALGRQLEAKAREHEGDAAIEAWDAVARVYDRVAADFEGEPAAAARAAFRAGEAWWRHGDAAQAERAFLAAAAGDPEHYRQRALLAAADVQRRDERLEDALATYGRAAEAEPGTARALTAHLWRGRLLLRLQRPDEALAVLRAAIESASTARQTIEAVNVLARALVERGDFDGAAAVLERADAAVDSEAGARPDRAESLRRALQGMSARRALQRARDARMNVVRDARDLERGADR